MPSGKLEKLFGEILRKKRNEAGYSQEKLALDCGLDRTYISLLERGLRQPTLTTIFKICQNLEIKPHCLIKELEQFSDENLTD